jgi:type I restriction enzyme S subunit
MKPSGIEWIGDIPAKWEVKRIKYCYDILLGKMLQSFQERNTDREMSYMCSANVTWNGIDLSVLKKMWFSPIEIKKYLLQEGDLLVAEGGDVGIASVWNNEVQDCCIQNALHLVKKGGRHSNIFLYYWLYHLKHSGYIDRVCNKATIAHFTKEKFGESPLCVPPPKEQIAIAAFLDTRCRRIDRIITEMEQQIEVLKQYKTSLITETVTKGLDKTVPMKPSGIKWIGDIPAKWEVKPVKYILESNRATLKETTKADYSFKYIDISSVDFDKGITGYEKMSFDNAPSRARRIVRKGDTIVSTVRTYLKAIARIEDDENIIVSTGFAVLSPKTNDPIFIEYFCKSDVFCAEIERLSYGIAYPAINESDMLNIKMILPPPKEQTAIAAFLDAQCRRINHISAEKQQAVETMKAYKKSLIYEYVTGKKRVKGYLQ